jgi:pimeloyl-[acyl-carrier protein] methyl ester esterase
MERVRSDSDRTIVLLPGMDGTGALFEPLLGVIPACFSTQIVQYPPDRPLSYEQLLPLVREQVPVDRRLVLVAESFSGPLALRFVILPIFWARG